MGLKIWSAQDETSHRFEGFLITDRSCTDRPFCFVDGKLGPMAGALALAKDLAADATAIDRLDKRQFGYGSIKGAVVDLRQFSRRDNTRRVPAWLRSLELRPVDDANAEPDYCYPFELDSMYRQASVANVAIVEVGEAPAGGDARMLLARRTQKTMAVELSFGSVKAYASDSASEGDCGAVLFVHQNTSAPRLLELLSGAMQACLHMWPFFARGEDFEIDLNVPKKEAAQLHTSVDPIACRQEVNRSKSSAA